MTQALSLKTILTLGLSLRLGLLILFLARTGGPEAWEYDELAKSLLSGNGYALLRHGTLYRSFAMPAYPLLSAFFHALAGPGFIPFYAFNLAAAACSIGLAYLISKRWFGPRVGLTTAFLVAIEPGLIVYQSYKIEVMSLSILLILIFFHGLLRTDEEKGRFAALLPGLAGALALLTRPDCLPLMAIAAATVFFDRSKKSLTRAVLILLCAALALSPWIIRNKRIHGRWILFTTTSGEHLWIGNNPLSTGSNTFPRRLSTFSAAAEQWGEKLFTLNEDSQNALFHREAMRFIRSDPAAFLGRCLSKFRLFWWFAPGYSNQYAWLPPGMAQAYKIFYAALLVLIILGASEAACDPSMQTRRAALYLASFVLMVCLIHSIYFVEGRHRVMVMPILLIFAARGAVFCRDFLKHSLFPVPKNAAGS